MRGIIYLFIFLYSRAHTISYYSLANYRKKITHWPGSIPNKTFIDNTSHTMLRTTSTFFRKNILQSNVLLRSAGERLTPSPFNEGVVVPPFSQVRTNRVTSGVTRKKRHKKIINLAKVNLLILTNSHTHTHTHFKTQGFRGRSKNCFRLARNRAEKALQHAYVGRKLKKRNARKEWIVSCNAAAREHGINYSLMIRGLKNANVELNRKILSELAQTEPFAFKSLTLTAKSELDSEWVERRNKHEAKKLYAIKEEDLDEKNSIPEYTTMQKILKN